MEAFVYHYSGALFAVAGCACAIAAILVKRNGRNAATMVPSGTVLLHQLPRGPKAPSISPFPLKLETFLRMHNIPYVNDFKSPFAKQTKKTPWMEYNGVKVPDSQMCIEHLKQELGLPNDPHLSDSERATGRAFLKLAEENLYWCFCATTFIDYPSYLRTTLPYTGIKFALMSRLLIKTICNEMYGHGIGRHSSKTIDQIGRMDLKAISDFLGDKSYMMGDTPSEIDCVIFANLCTLVYQLEDCPLHRYVRDDLPNLEPYVVRMRDKYWPDWDECLAKKA